MKKFTLSVLITLSVIIMSFSQTLNTHIQFESNNKGVLFPNVTTVARIAMSPSVAETSLLVYDTDLKKYMFWDGSEWKQVNNDQYVFPIENNVLIGERVGENLDFTGNGENGRSNTFIGDLAGLQNTTGHRNTFVGDGAGRENREGESSTNLGLFAAGNVEHGLANVTIGDLAGAGTAASDDSLTYSVVIGSYTYPAATRGIGNVFIGQSAGAEADSVRNSTVIGYQAGRKMKGQNNVVMGPFAGYNIERGSSNSFVGSNSGLSNISGSQNAFFGNQSGQANTTGKFNTFIGDFSGKNSSQGDGNTYIGKSAGFGNDGDYNIMIGRSAGGTAAITAVDSSIFIGINAGSNAPESHSLVIESGDPAFPLIKGNFKNNSIELNASVRMVTNQILPLSSVGFTCNNSLEGLLYYDNDENKLKLCTETSTGVFGWVNLN